MQRFNRHLQKTFVKAANLEPPNPSPEQGSGGEVLYEKTLAVHEEGVFFFFGDV
jgi:hypothetical protein